VTGIKELVLSNWSQLHRRCAECFGANLGPRLESATKTAKAGTFAMETGQHCHESNKMRMAARFCHAALHFRIAMAGRMSVT
jgi:hypothetical protein